MRSILFFLSLALYTFVKAHEPNVKFSVGAKAPANVPLVHFEKNKAQWPEQVLYKIDLGGARRLFMEVDRFTYVFHSTEDLYRIHQLEHKKETSEELVRGHAFQVRFVNSNLSCELKPGNKLPFHHNYYIGNDPSRWSPEVPVFSEVTYANLYQSIDIHAYSRGKEFKYDYIVHPGADVKTIQLNIEGAEKVFLRNNTLVIATSVGELIESIPYSYQVIDGKEVEVPCRYQLNADGKTVSFELPEGYNPSHTLYIDPVVMASTYSGSSAVNYGHCATYDAAGNIYTGARSFNQGYPVTTGAIQSTFGGNVDIAISKLNPTGTTLIYATYIGGSSSEFPHSMYVDNNNQLFVYGSANSANYPTTAGCYDNTHNGQSDMVISKLNPTGTTLLGSTFVGGSGQDGINSTASYNYGDNYRGEIIVNAAGEPYIAGTTASNNFPTTTGAYDVTHNGGQDAAVFKMNSALTAMIWSTFLGGSSEEAGCSIRLNTSGEVYVVGLTKGTGFPTTPGALNGTYMGGTYDGFAVRLNSAGTTLLNSTFLGTSALDIAYFVDLDYNNHIYVYGVSGGSMPISPGVYSNPGSETFLMKLDASLTNIIYSTVLGNGTHGSFSPSALMVDLCQKVYMSGWGTTSNYPVTPNAVQSTTDGSDFHITVLEANGLSLEYATFFGASTSGEHVDGGTSRFDPNGIVYQGVCACDGGFPTLQGGYSPNNAASGCDVAVFKIDIEPNCNPLNSTQVLCYGATATVGLMNHMNLTNVSYSIQPGGMVSTNSVFTVPANVSTTYTLFVTGVNYLNANVTNTGLATVSVVPQPSVAPTLTQASCTSSLNAFDLNLQFLPPGTPGYTISWSPIPNGIFSPTQTAANGGITAGVYDATITSQHGCVTTTSFDILPVPVSMSISPMGPFVINCTQPTVTVSLDASNTYTWYGLTANYSGPSATFTLGNVGTWTVVGQNPGGCIGTQTFQLNSNTAVPASTVVPLTQNITCTLSSVTQVTAHASPSVNVEHIWLSPLGGSLTTMGSPSAFLPGAPGTYTHMVRDISNGCFVTQTFTVSSTSGFPTYTVISPQNFTLGCSSKSVALINIVGADTYPITGGPISYTILPPGFSGGYSTGSLSNYNVTVPGTWSVITKDNTNFCETMVQVTVLQNTITPNVSAEVPYQVLTCNVPTITLKGLSTTPNVKYEWHFPGNPGSVPEYTVKVESTNNVTSSVIANYTLLVTDNNNACVSTSVIPMLQNKFPPNAVFSGDDKITCKTSTINFSNQSSTNIPPAFSPVSPVIGYIWRGPSPQLELQVSSTYVGGVPGTYTMIAKDLNNGCTAMATRFVDDQRDYPVLNQPQPDPFILDCGETSRLIYPIITGTTTGFDYTWITPVSSTVTSVKTRSISVTLPGTYFIIVENQNNGCISQGAVEVETGELHADFTPGKISGFAPLEVNFVNNSFSSSASKGREGITSVWNFNNGEVQTHKSATVNPTALFARPGDYTVTLYAQKGVCLDTAIRYIHVEVPSRLEIPNVFTPNKDGVNDEFFLKADNLIEINVSITDRWGHKVFEVMSTTGNVLWDGKNQFGEDVAEGTYFIILKATGKDGEQYDHQGTLMLIR